MFEWPVKLRPLIGPGRTEVRPGHEAELRAFLELLQDQTPVTLPVMRECLRKLSTHLRDRNRTPEQKSLMLEDYIRLLGHYPEREWRDATDELLVTATWFPSLAEISTALAQEAEKRRVRISLASRMLAKIADHEPARTS